MDVVCVVSILRMWLSYSSYSDTSSVFWILLGSRYFWIVVQTCLYTRGRFFYVALAVTGEMGEIFNFRIRCSIIFFPDHYYAWR